MFRSDNSFTLIGPCSSRPRVGWLPVRTDRHSRPKERLHSRTFAPPALLIVVLVFAARSFRINQEYEREALFRLGRLGVTKGPCLDRLFPLVDRVVGVDMRTVTVQLDTQDSITQRIAGGPAGAAD
ncbi:MAG: hypothetical protein QE280_02775 [Caulobacter sp.]|nr:hypothetical protein [Caulobacter sp.]